MGGANQQLILAIVIALLFFFASPGVIFTFPESNITSTSDPKRPNQVNLMFAAVCYGIVLSFALPFIQQIIPACGSK